MLGEYHFKDKARSYNAHTKKLDRERVIKEKEKSEHNLIVIEKTWF